MKSKKSARLPSQHEVTPLEKYLLEKGVIKTEDDYPVTHAALKYLKSLEPVEPTHYPSIYVRIRYTPENGLAWESNDAASVVAQIATTFDVRCPDCGYLPGERVVHDSRQPLEEGWVRQFYKYGTVFSLRTSAGGCNFLPPECSGLVDGSLVVYWEVPNKESDEPDAAPERGFVAHCHDISTAARMVRTLNSETPRRQTDKCEAVAPTPLPDKDSKPEPSNKDPQEYIDTLKRFGKTALVVEDLKESTDGTRRIRIGTAKHSYSISFRPPCVGKKFGYMGCISSCLFPREGESWTRGNDLADGTYSDETWVRILNDIVAYELIPEAYPATMEPPLTLKYQVSKDSGDHYGGWFCLSRYVSESHGVSNQPLAYFVRPGDAQWVARLLNGEGDGYQCAPIVPGNLPVIDMLEVTSRAQEERTFVSNMKELAGRVLTVVDASIEGTKNAAIKTLIKKEFREQMHRVHRTIFYDEHGEDATVIDPENEL